MRIKFYSSLGRLVIGIHLHMLLCWKLVQVTWRINYKQILFCDYVGDMYQMEEEREIQLEQNSF